MFKSIIFGWSLFILASLFLLISCDGDPQPRNRFDFASGSSYTSGNRTNVPAGEILSTSLYAETASADTKFTKLTITCNYDTAVSIVGKPTVTYLDSALNTNNLAMIFTVGTRGIAGREYWTFNLEDNQGKIYTKKYRIVTTKANAVYQAYTSTFYHKSALENISYFSTSNGQAYPGYVGRADAFKEATDFFFQINDPVENKFSLRSTASSRTTFRISTLTTDQFNSIATVAAITEAYNTNTAEESQINKTKADPVQIVAFKTAKNKFGVMRMDTLQVLPTGNEGQKMYRLLYSIKMQKP